MKRTNVGGGLPQRRQELGVDLRVRRLDLLVADAKLSDGDAVELLRHAPQRGISVLPHLIDDAADGLILLG